MLRNADALIGLERVEGEVSMEKQKCMQATEGDGMKVSAEAAQPSLVEELIRENELIKRISNSHGDDTEGASNSSVHSRVSEVLPTANTTHRANTERKEAERTSVVSRLNKSGVSSEHNGVRADSHERAFQVKAGLFQLLDRRDAAAIRVLQPC